MELHFPDLAYDCLTCGKGCRAGWRIPVEADVRPGLAASQAAAAVAERGFVPLEALGERIVLGHQPDGSCVFLRPDQLCQAHAELGLEAKPLQCQQFPFIPVNTPDGVFIGMSFLCSAVQRRHGRPASEHREQVESLVTRLWAKLGGLSPAQLRAGDASIALTRERSLDWEAYRRVEEQVQEALRGDPYRGLWQACQTLLPGVPEEVAGDMILFFAANLVGLAEAGEPSQRQAVTQALLGGQSFPSARLGRQIEVAIDSPHLDHARGTAPAPPWMVEEMRRYLSHLVFRKFLIQGSSILSQALALLVLLPVLDFYVRLASAGRAPQVEDFYFALDTVEGELITHADGVAPVFAFFEQALAGQAQPQ